MHLYSIVCCCFVFVLNSTAELVLDQEACSLLTSFCIRDPECLNEKVFYKRCIQRSYDALSQSKLTESYTNQESTPRSQINRGKTPYDQADSTVLNNPYEIFERDPSLKNSFRSYEKQLTAREERHLDTDTGEYYSGQQLSDTTKIQATPQEDNTQLDQGSSPHRETEESAEQARTFDSLSRREKLAAIQNAVDIISTYVNEKRGNILRHQQQDSNVNDNGGLDIQHDVSVQDITYFNQKRTQKQGINAEESTLRAREQTQQAQNSPSGSLYLDEDRGQKKRAEQPDKEQHNLSEEEGQVKKENNHPEKENQHLEQDRGDAVTDKDSKKEAGLPLISLPRISPIFDADSNQTQSAEKNREEVAAIKVEDTPEDIIHPETQGYSHLIILNFESSISVPQALDAGKFLQGRLWNQDKKQKQSFALASGAGRQIALRMITQTKETPQSIAQQINQDSELKLKIGQITGIKLVNADIVEDTNLQAEEALPVKVRVESKPLEKLQKLRFWHWKNWDQFALIIAIVGGCTLGLIITSLVVCAIKRKKDSNLPIPGYKAEAAKDYQELCRSQRSVSGQTGGQAEEESKENVMKHSWGDESFPYNMDITTGHAVLTYMEDHLNNENRLNKEWEALCGYVPDRNDTKVAQDAKNVNKNRYMDVLPYDHSRVKLKETSNSFHSDYVNANYIIDTDPRNPDYIACQGPLDNTVADFWQMVWEQGIVVIVNLTKLSDMGLQQCHRYWPEEGSEIYHIYEVHLISEHIWCDDYLVRSLYLKNLQTSETRTVTQFHYLTWPDLSVPNGPKPLLEFRRKVNKCYRGHACPIVVHCNNGVGRTGTYILIDMVLNKMVKGAKEIDMAATLEHIRDQRPDVVKTRQQFEFSLLAVAEEVTAILSSLPSR